MLKILIILVVYYVIIMSTDSRNMNMYEKEYINDGNSSKYVFKTRFNNSDEESKNITTSEKRTHLELIGLQNKSNNCNELIMNQTSAIEDKFINNSENKTKECLLLQKESEIGFNNTVENLKIDIAAENITEVKVNYSEKSNSLNINNQTSVIEDELANVTANENKTNIFLDPLIGRTHEQEFIPTLVPNSPENKVNDTQTKMQPSIGNRISTNAIISLMGGPG